MNDGGMIGPMDLSIIIVSWNTCNLLAQCLDSIYAYPSHYEFEVWVVDNASSDGTVGMVRNRFPQVRLIENHANLGFARANNQAIRESTGSYVLLLNPDTVILPNALESMIRFADEHKDVGLLGGNLFNVDRTPQVCYGNTPTLISEVLSLLSLDRRPFIPDRLRSSIPRTREPNDGFLSVGWVLGACMFIRRTALDQVGLLDEGYYVFSEETDWARRARAGGWNVVYLASAGILHHGGASTRQVSHRMLPSLYATKARYLGKYEGVVSAFIFRAAVSAVVCAKGLWGSLTHFSHGRALLLGQSVLIVHHVWHSSHESH